MRAAAVQLQATTDTDRNLASAERLVRAAAADGAELVVLPERLDIRGAASDYLAGAEPLDGRPVTWARELARELGIDLVAGSVAERREGHERVSNTSVHVGPDGEIRAVYRKIHMFDVEVGGHGLPRVRALRAGRRDRAVRDRRAASGLGLTICYDLRFPELYRILALRGARIVTVPANFTRVTGEAHWEVLLRARAIENQVFVIAPGQGRPRRPRGRQLRQLDDRRPVGRGARPRARGGRARHRRRPRPRPPGRDPREAAEPRQPRGGGVPLAARGSPPSGRGSRRPRPTSAA